MTAITLTVNGQSVNAEVTPRTHLADFLREHLLLTGTHIGCEHGICGACTVAIDGEIARSCITYAAACDGADIRTIEGYDDDALMGRLRKAFSEAHALQCGYCTPGMLIAARDLIRRKGGLSAAAIRTEMSGNLCRCTGYIGIVTAISKVMAERAALDLSSLTVRLAGLGPAPGPAASQRELTPTADLPSSLPGSGRARNPIETAR
ncbi:MAG: (2Fe-2S)-binding protein, partial [Hyphomicrobiales bacterium]|nr:(2Fe-2S)-binding protein [Hyphomicrobiales bacterium]